MYVTYKLEITLKRPSGSIVLKSYDMSNVPPFYNSGTTMTIDGRLVTVVSSHVCVEIIDGIETIIHQIVVE